MRIFRSFHAISVSRIDSYYFVLQSILKPPTSQQLLHHLSKATEGRNENERNIPTCTRIQYFANETRIVISVTQNCSSDIVFHLI